MKGLFLAIQLLTVFPIRFTQSVEADELGRSTAFFPLVGALQGIILVVSNIILSKFLPHNLADALLLVILILINGGFHLDGFADTIDGIAGGNTKEERLRIMRDSRIGAIGVAALVLLILIKFLSINSLSLESKNVILFLFPVFGKWAIVPMAYLLDYAREGEGVGKPFAEYTTEREVIIATLWTFIFSFIFFRWIGLIYITAFMVFTTITARFFRKRIGGVTGDVFGFYSEVAEILFIIINLFNIK